MSMEITLTDKIALVTGASRGIGKSVAMILAQAGAQVVGTATSDAGAQKIAANFEGAGLPGHGFVVDVGDPDAIAKLVSEVEKKVGAPNILVNNAAITRDNLFLRMKESEWHDVIRTNLDAMFHLTKACIRSMVKARWGRIISISSVVGVTGNPGQANYCAAKAGVIGFTKSIAQELAGRNITANTVAPGFIETDMTAALTDQQKEAILAQIPSKRMGKPEDIAQAVAFLASEGASYITGATLHVNGGMAMI